MSNIRSRKFRAPPPVTNIDTWLPTEFYLEHANHFPLVTVDVVALDAANRFLLLKRNRNNLGWRGTWATPGGRVHRNERLTDAARRILMRETGLSTSPSKFSFKGVQEIFTPEEHGVTNVFKVRTKETNVIVDDTSSRAKWFTPITAPPSLKAEYREILHMCDVEIS